MNGKWRGHLVALCSFFAAVLCTQTDTSRSGFFSYFPEKAATTALQSTSQPGGITWDKKVLFPVALPGSGL